MSQDIVDFLSARYADHKSAALGAKGTTDGRWTQDDGPPEDIVLYDKCDKLAMGQARHIARHDPAFVLADLDAKEQVLRELPGLEWHEPCVSLVGLILALLALPYADHPDYREEWRP